MTRVGSSQARERQAEAPLLEGAATLVAALVGVGLVYFVYIFGLHGYLTVRFPYQLDYGEGPILQLAMRVAEGRSPYPPVGRPPYEIASYDPLHYLLCGLGVKLFGANFLFGRLLSLVCAVGAAAAAALVAWRHTGHRFATFLAGGLVLAMPHFLVWSTLMRVDMLALGLAMGGYFAFERGWRWAGMPLFALGMFTRRTNVAALGASFLAEARRRGWRPTMRLFAIQAVMVAALFGAAEVATGRAMSRVLYLHTASSLGKAWTWEQLWSLIWFPLRMYPVYFALPVAGAAWCGWRRERRLLALYFLTAGVVFLTGGRIGSAHNYLLEPLAVGAMLFAVMWADLSRTRGWGRTTLSFLGLVLLWQMLYTGQHLPQSISLSQPRADAGASRAVVERLREAPGPVLCEDTGLAILAGKRPPLMPFEFTQMARRGALDPEPVLRQVREGAFSVVVLRFNPFDPHEIELHRPGEDWKAGRWPEGLIAALVARYRLEVEVGPYFVFVPT